MYLGALLLMCFISIVLSTREYNLTYITVRHEKGGEVKEIVRKPFFLYFCSILFSLVHLIAFYVLLADDEDEMRGRYWFVFLPCVIISGIMAVLLAGALSAATGGPTILGPFWAWSVDAAPLGAALMALMASVATFALWPGELGKEETLDHMRRTVAGWYSIMYMFMLVVAWYMVIQPPELSEGFSWKLEWGSERWRVIDVHISPFYLTAAILCLLQPIFAALLTLATTIPVKYWERRKAERLLRPVRPLRSPREMLLELVRREIRISLDSLSSKTGLNKRKVERLLGEMLDGGQLTGVLDRRAGTFTYVPDHKIEAIRRFIRSRGIVSIRELARKYSLTEREIELLLRKYARGGKTFK